MFRTDWGDNEGEDEWNYGHSDEDDEPGDDDVDIVIRKDGQVLVEYRDPNH